MSVLGVIKSEMDSLRVPYEFMRWTAAVTYPYWVGESSESPTMSEDGSKETTLILTGTTKGSWLELEQTRAKLENHFHPIYGLRKSTDDGVVVIFYENSFTVQTGEADLKRIQVNLKIKEWRNIQ